MATEDQESLGWKREEKVKYVALQAKEGDLGYFLAFRRAHECDVLKEKNITSLSHKTSNAGTRA